MMTYALDQIRGRVRANKRRAKDATEATAALKTLNKVHKGLHGTLPADSGAQAERILRVFKEIEAEQLRIRADLIDWQMNKDTFRGLEVPEHMPEEELK